MVKHRSYGAQSFCRRPANPLVIHGGLLCRFLFLDRQLRRKNVHGSKSALAQSAQAQRVMALGQPAAIVIDDKAAMIPGRRFEAESAKEQNLPRG